MVVSLSGDTLAPLHVHVVLSIPHNVHHPTVCQSTVLQKGQFCCPIATEMLGCDTISPPSQAILVTDMWLSSEFVLWLWILILFVYTVFQMWDMRQMRTAAEARERTMHRPWFTNHVNGCMHMDTMIPQSPFKQRPETTRRGRGTGTQNEQAVVHHDHLSDKGLRPRAEAAAQERTMCRPWFTRMGLCTRTCPIVPQSPFRQRPETTRRGRGKGEGHPR